MLSYKEYKQLNESLYGAFNLGLRQPNVVSGVVGSTGATEALESPTETTEATEEGSVLEVPEEEGNDLEEAKKCGMAMKKGMDCEKEEKEDHKHKKHKKEDEEDKAEEEEKEENDDEEEKEEKEEKGLTAAQKKLPEGLQKAILAKKSKKEWSEVMADVESLLENVKNQKVIDLAREAMNQVKNSLVDRELTEEEKAWWNSVNSQLS